MLVLKNHHHHRVEPWKTQLNEKYIKNKKLSCFVDCHVIAIATDKMKEDVGVGGDDVWYTADEGVFDKDAGRYVSSPTYLERLEVKERERKSISSGEEVKSSTKLELQFDLDEVCNTCIDISKNTAWSFKR